MRIIQALAVGVIVMVTNSLSLAQTSVERTLIDLENQWESRGFSRGRQAASVVDRRWRVRARPVTR